MKLILITSPKSIRNRYEMGDIKIVLLFSALVAFPILFGFAAFFSASSLSDPRLNETLVEKWTTQLNGESEEIVKLKDKSELELQALTLALADAQTRLIRLEALGERLIAKGRLEKGEFDFSHRVALGGIQEGIGDDAFEKPQFMEEIDGLLQRLDGQQTQMKVLDSLLNNRLIEKDVFLAGRPIRKGWMSSFYGKRLDPFSGKLAYHKGVDFAGKENADIIAVASGIVTWSEERDGYGLIVEIDHGEGFKTRYAHNKTNLVKVGDLVSRGQTLALMGSTGRSTGPHTHFEVLRNNRQVNPEQYVNRVVRP